MTSEQESMLSGECGVARAWMKPAAAIDPPYLCVYRNRFELTQDATLEFDYSADERCVIYCDGRFITSGPERGTAKEWLRNHVSLPLVAGSHVLAAAAYCFGEAMTAHGQMSIRHGFWLQECGATHLGRWECQLADGCAFVNTKTDWGTYPHILTDESFNWRIFSGEGGQWSQPAIFEDRRVLSPATLPPIISDEEVTSYDRMGNVFLFHDYVTVWCDYEFSGTGEVRVRWAEPGCDARDFTPQFLCEQKPGDCFGCFSGPGDRFILNGGRIHWTDYFWRAGRTLEITVFGNARIESARFRKAGYPWKLEKPLAAGGDQRLTQLLERSWRTIAACTAETFMDCPYYEQLQYISDTRLVMLSLDAVTSDRRLTEKALRQFAQGQFAGGAMPCRYPTKQAVKYTPEHGELYTIHIPSFTAFWPQMVHDYALAVRDPGKIWPLLPSVRKAAGYLWACTGASGGDRDEVRLYGKDGRLPARREDRHDGLLHVPGWNFIDWLENWEAGIPPHCRDGVGCTLNLIFIRALKDLADLEQHLGNRRESAVAAERAALLGKRVREAFYLPDRQCYAEDAGHAYVSEHAQVWALLALGDTSVIPALESGDLDECGIAFSFYYLAAARFFGLETLFRRRLQKYIDTAADPRLRTMPELFPNHWWLRSNCHAWSAHAIYWQFGQGSILDRLSGENAP